LSHKKKAWGEVATATGVGASAGTDSGGVGVLNAT